MTTTTTVKFNPVLDIATYPLMMFERLDKLYAIQSIDYGTYLFIKERDTIGYRVHCRRKHERIRQVRNSVIMTKAKAWNAPEKD